MLALLGSFILAFGLYNIHPLSNVTGFKTEYVYLVFDPLVLLLSLTYIPVTKIFYSLLTVALSSKLVGVIQKIGGHEKA